MAAKEEAAEEEMQGKAEAEPNLDGVSARLVGGGATNGGGCLVYRARGVCLMDGWPDRGVVDCFVFHPPPKERITSHHCLAQTTVCLQGSTGASSDKCFLAGKNRRDTQGRTVNVKRRDI